MKHLDIFQTESSFDSVANALQKPWVMYISENKELRYSSDYKQEDPHALKFVDLSLPSGTLWANKNIGAVEEADFGNYYTFGALEYQNVTKEGNLHTATPLPYPKSDVPLTKIGQSNLLSNGILKSEYDAATQELGEDYIIPTTNDIKELLNNVTIKIVSDAVTPYALLTSKTDPTKFLTIPCGGLIENSSSTPLVKYGSIEPYIMLSDYQTFPSLPGYGKPCYVIRENGSAPSLQTAETAFNIRPIQKKK